MAPRKLPVEIGLQVIDHITPDPPVYNLEDAYYHLHTLRMCALVCKDWLSRSRLYLFHTIYVQDARRFDSLISNFSDPNSRFPKLVKVLIINDCQARSEEGSREWYTITSHGSTAKSLQDSRVPIHKVLLFALGKLPNLYALHIGGTRDQPVATTLVAPFPFNNMTRTCLMALRRSNIHDMTLYSIPSHRAGHLLKALPSLRTLRCGFLLRESNSKPTAHLFCPSKLSLTSLQVIDSRNENDIINCIIHASRQCLENLSISGAFAGNSLLNLSKLTRLQSLDLVLGIGTDVNDYTKSDIMGSIRFLQAHGEAPSNTLKRLCFVCPSPGDTPLRMSLLRLAVAGVLHPLSQLDSVIADVLERRWASRMCHVVFTVSDGVKWNAVQDIKDTFRKIFPEAHKSRLSQVDLNIPSFGHTSAISTIKVSPGGHWISTSDAASLTIWNAQTCLAQEFIPRTRYNTQRLHWFVQLPDGSDALLQVEDKPETSVTWSIEVWDLSKHQILAEISIPTWQPRCAASNPDRTILAISDIGGMIHFWDAGTFEPILPTPLYAISPTRILAPPNNLWMSVYFKFVDYGEYPCVAPVCRLRTSDAATALLMLREEVASLSYGRVLCVTFDEDSVNAIATIVTLDGIVHQWDLASGDILCQVQLYHQSGEPCGELASATLSQDGRIACWVSKKIQWLVNVSNTWDGLLVRTLDHGPELQVAWEKVHHISVSPDGKYAAVTSEAYLLVLWRLADGKRLVPGFLRRKGGAGRFNTFSQDSKLIVTPTEIGTIVVSRLDDLFEDVE